MTDRRFWRRSIGSEQRVASLIEHLSERSGGVSVAYVGRLSGAEPRELGAYSARHPGITLHARSGPLRDAVVLALDWLRRVSWPRDRARRRDPRIAGPRATDSRPARTANPLFRLRSPARRAFVHDLIRRSRPGVVIVCFARLTPLVEPRPRGAPRDVRYLIDTHDVLHQRAARFRASGAREFLDVDAAQEAEALATYDAILAIQAVDQRTFARLVPARPVLLAPHGLPLPDAIVDSTQRAADATAAPDPIRLGFLGGRDESNADALAWFLEHVWPELRARHPRAVELVVAGPVCERPSFARDAGATPGVRFLGPVESIATFWPTVDVAVNPVRFGSGLKIKNVEALAFGRPLVTTAIGAEGIESAAGEALLVADSSAEWIEVLTRMQREPALRQTLGRAARRHAESRFAPSAAFAELDAYLDARLYADFEADPASARERDASVLVLSSRRAFEAFTGALPPAWEERFAFVKPSENRRLDRLLPRARLVITQSYTRPELNRRVFAARRRGIATLLLIDGPLEWSSVHANPSLRRAGNEAARGLFQPVIHDAVAAIGPSQAKVIEAWNAGRGLATFCYANHRIRTELPPSGPPEFDFLLTTARTAAFDDRERSALSEALARCAAALESAGHATLVRIFDEGLRRVVRAKAPSATFETEGRFSEALARVRCVIGTPSSVLLESIHHGRPTAILGFRDAPLYYEAGWVLAGDAAPDAVFAAMLAHEPVAMSRQRRTLAAELSSEDFFAALECAFRNDALARPRPLDAADLEFERCVRAVVPGWRERLFAPIYRLLR